MEIESEFDSHQMKCMFWPELADKEPWDEADWNLPIAICECGGEIVAGIAPPKFHLGIADGDYNFTSHSLAINPSQAAAHKKLYPDVGVNANGTLAFKSVKSHDRYLDKTGFVKQRQKVKPRGTTK
jgi:hypothetical protein